MRTLVVALCLILGGCDSMVRRADLADPPPAPYRGLPLRPGWTIHRPATLEEVTAYCKAKLGDGSKDDHGRYAGCTDAELKQIVSPAIGRAVDAKRQASLDEHEISHSYGLKHPRDTRDSSLWLDEYDAPIGKRLTARQEAALQMKLKADAEAERRLAMMRQMYPDRANLFAAAPQAPPAQNLFRAR